MANDRPKLKIEKDQLDYFLEWAALATLLLTFIIPQQYYASLPESIPTHFGIDGEADAFGSKRSLWILPIISLAIFILFYFISKIPHKFNYPRAINEQNAYANYKHALRGMRLLLLFILAAFLYVIWMSIQVGLGNRTGLGWSFVLVFLTTIFGLIFYLTKGFKK